MIEIKSKRKKKSKSKIGLADCLLKTEDFRHKSRFAYCLLPTVYLFRLLLTAYCLLAFTTELHPTIRYVSHTGSSTPPYTSWETAADSIQKAINFCEPGDTVLVANGVYYEGLYINKTIHLIGSSMDSTVIDGTNVINYRIVYFFENNSTMKNFTITSSNPQRSGLVTRSSNLIAEFCKIKNLQSPLIIGYSSVNISNFKIYAFLYGITDECPNDTCNSVYSNNIIIAETNLETPVWFGFGGYPTFTNNIVLGSGNLRGVDIQYHRGAIVKNNLVSGTSSINIRAGQIRTDTAYFENNISLNSLVAYLSSTAHRTVIRNNIAKDVLRGVQSGNGTVIPDYNLFWNVDELVYGTAIPGDSNIVADPMFVKDTMPNPQMDFDYHLQAYSPAIDAGTPSILDVDGSRSDIGMFGGPGGERYDYLDLAPRPPRNLSAVVDSNYILVKWNRNTEADTSHYNVYRDTVANFTIDSTKLISSQTDTFYIQYPPYQSSRYVYKITCVDKQGNESLPSEELVINITSLTTNDYPVTINDYLLYQNYPNPFNPSTTIAYKLKERAYVKLMVYDIKGELVSVLVNKEQEAGYYETEFNVGNGLPSVPNNLASGIYLYRIEVIGEGRIPVYSDMKKMILIK